MLSNKATMALFDIRDNAHYARGFVEGFTFEAFKDDRKTFYAVTRALEIISEAARRLPDEIRDRHPALAVACYYGRWQRLPAQLRQRARNLHLANSHDRMPELVAVVMHEIDNA